MRRIAGPHRRPELNSKRVLLLVLGISYALRLALVLQGGQRFFPDEGRFERSFDGVRNLSQLGPADTLWTLIGYPDHPALGILALPAACAQVLGLELLGLPVIFDQPVGLHIAAAVGALWSVGALAASYALARRMGAPVGAGLLGCGLMAVSISLLYYARQLVPYDAALCLGLMAAALGATARPSAATSVGCGLLAGLAIATYSGYWALALTALLVHLASRGPERFELSRRLALAGLGIVAPMAMLLVLNSAHSGLQFLGATTTFAASVVQGDFSEGWSLPWEYLWHTEHLLLILWIVCTGALLVMRGRKDTHTAHLLLLAALGVYVLLASAALIGLFVGYGRMARQIVPFISLASGCVLFDVARTIHGRRWLAALALALVANAATMFVQAFGIVFPRTFLERVGPTDASVVSTVLGPSQSPPPITTRLVLVNVNIPYPIVARADLPAGRTLMQARHALEFVPYQYEGYAPAERQLLRSTDISMRLIDTAQ